MHIIYFLAKSNGEKSKMSQMLPFPLRLCLLNYNIYHLFLEWEHSKWFATSAEVSLEE